MSPAEQLFQDLQESRLFKALLKLSRTSWVVTDDDTLPLLKEYLGKTARLFTLCQLSEFLESTRSNTNSTGISLIKRRLVPEQVIVASATQENLLYQQVCQQITNYDCKVYRLFNDVFINLTTNTGELLTYSRQPDSCVLEKIHKYAIISIPRSGSTMLADILFQTGYCGQPKEHLRNSIVLLATVADSFDFQKWLGSMLVNTCTANNVFGTKVISHFAHSLSNDLKPSDIKFLQQFKHTKLIYLSREDKADQAVSTYIARQSNLFFTPTLIHKSKRLKFIKTLDYDFDALYECYQKIIDAENATAQFIQSLGLSVLEVGYENLVNNQTQTIERILSFLNIETSEHLVISKPRTKPVRDRHCQPFREQFAADLARIEANNWKDT
ncbi:MAG: Stf0 family sulfotransferase [Methylococcales bacterium]